MLAKNRCLAAGGTVALLLLVLLAAGAAVPAAAARQLHLLTPVRAPSRSLLSCSTGFIVRNKCTRPLRLALEALLSDERGMKAGYCNNGIVLPNVVSADVEEWCVRGWFTMQPNEDGYVVWTNNRYVYYYAELEDGSVIWRGQDDNPWINVATGQHCTEGSSPTCKQFRKVDTGEGCMDTHTLTLTCPDDKPPCGHPDGPPCDGHLPHNPCGHPDGPPCNDHPSDPPHKPCGHPDGPPCDDQPPQSPHKPCGKPGGKPCEDQPPHNPAKGTCHMSPHAHTPTDVTCKKELLNSILDVKSADDCCNKCTANADCNLFVWCDPAAAKAGRCNPGGLGSGSLPGDCILYKTTAATGLRLQYCIFDKGDWVTWTTGIVDGREFTS